MTLGLSTPAARRRPLRLFSCLSPPRACPFSPAFRKARYYPGETCSGSAATVPLALGDTIALPWWTVWLVHFLGATLAVLWGGDAAPVTTTASVLAYGARSVAGRRYSVRKRLRPRLDSLLSRFNYDVTDEVISVGIAVTLNRHTGILNATWAGPPFRRVGEAQNPGPEECHNMLARGRPACANLGDGELTILTANVTALRPKAALVAGWGADITMLQETKVSPAVIGFVRAAFSENQRTLHHGQLCRTAERRAARVASAAREAAKGGVAIAVAHPREAAKADSTPLTKELRATGRWEEVLVPAGRTSTHFGAATIYGVSGASKDSRCHRENEALLAKAVMRVLEAGDLPYVLAGDINVNPAESEVIASAVEAGILVDLGHAARARDDPDPTFRRSGPFEGMTEDDAATSRIDVILANPTAAASVTSFCPRWDLVIGDHVPLEAKFNVGAYCKEVCRYDGPRPIDVSGIPDVHPDVQQSAYYRARTLFRTCS